MLSAVSIRQALPILRPAVHQHHHGKLALKAFVGHPPAPFGSKVHRIRRSLVFQAERSRFDMQTPVRTLVEHSFALGPFKKPKVGRAAIFTTRFGLVVLVLGLATLLFPDTFGGLYHDGAVTAGERGALQTNGIIVMVLGYFYFLAGRNNAEWFFAGSVLDRFAASLVAITLVVTGNASLRQVAGQIAVDVLSAVYTYKLYKQDMADRQQQQQ